eukprot:TRINITY_DN20548_c0_g1_i1.p1 TRINITY_DN20548_c0_g1~~TRINITY_DN20548_c0_g1_i1.p1  ORF type:complete len:430 (+),score=144.08 TRINITY_DN20548_c0_g1_i1:1270-2559(+)
MLCKKLFVRVVEGRGLANLIVGESSVYITLGEEKYHSRPCKMVNAKLAWKAEVLFNVENEDAVLRIDVKDCELTRATTVVDLRELFEGRTEKVYEIINRRGTVIPGAEMLIVLKAYGFGRTFEVTENDGKTTPLLPLPPLGDIKVSELEMLLSPQEDRTTAKLPSEPQFWLELSEAMKENPIISQTPPLIKTTTPDKTELKVNISYVMAFYGAWKKNRTHHLLIKDLEKEQAQKVCVNEEFWNTFISVVHVQRAAEKSAPPALKAGDMVAYQHPDKRNYELSQKGKITGVVKRGDRQYFTVDFIDGKKEKGVKPSMLRLWSSRLHLLVACSRFPKENFYISLDEWKLAIKEWAHTNSLGKYAWRAALEPSIDFHGNVTYTKDMPLSSLITGFKVVSGEQRRHNSRKDKERRKRRHPSPKHHSNITPPTS